MAAAERDELDEGKSRLSQRTDDEMCEAYVTLGRLSHVKACHVETTELMVRSLADAGARDAVESAMAKVRDEYDSLKENLEKLYRKSMADLHTRKMAMEAPTRARVELMAGQQKAVGDAEEELKALMANPDEEILMRELPQTLRRATRTLKSSIKLIGLRLPEAKPVSVEDFPPSRLHNVVIAPKRSGQRDRAQSPPRNHTNGARKRSASTKQPQMALEEKGGGGGGGGGQVDEEARAQQLRPANPLRSASTPTSVSDGRDEPLSSQSQSQPQSLASTAAAVAAGAVAAAAAAAAEAEGRGAAEASECCRNDQSKRRTAPAGWDEERDGELGDVGGAPIGVAAEACSHSACACRADDVWAAYRTLRKRYHVLKDHADQEEVRIRVEEQRREMRAELETKTLEMRADLDRERLEMEAEFETKKRVLNADFNGENGEVEPVAPAVAAAAAAPAAAPEGVLALSQAEVQSLREIVQASLEESKAMQRESAELRQKVALGEECLQEALNEALSLREEITKRTQHGEILLARIRFLKGQTAAYVKSTDWSAGEEGWGGMGTAAPVCAHSDYGSDSAIDSVTHRRRATAVPGQPKDAARRQRPRRRDSGIGASEDDAPRHSAFPRSPSEANGHDAGGYQSPPGELPNPKAAAHRQHPRRLDSGIGASEDNAPRHFAFPRSPSEANGHDTGGYQSPLGDLPKSRDAAGSDIGWIERAGRSLSGPSTNWDGNGGGGERGGDRKAQRLEREREHLTREVYKLSAQLEASEMAGTSSRLGPSDLDEDLSSRSFATSTSVPVDAATSPARRSRRRDEAVAAEAEEAVAVAVAAAERVSTTKAAVSRRDNVRGDGGGDDGRNRSNGHNRHLCYREDGGVPSLLRRSPSRTSMGLPDASADDSDCDSGTSGTSGRSRSDSPSWRSLARRRQQSLLAAEAFSRLPRRQRQRRERYEEAAVAKASRMSGRGRATQAASLWGRGAGGSDSDTSDKVLSEGSAGESSESNFSHYSGSWW